MMKEFRLTELDMKIIKQALVYTQSSWETWYEEGIFPSGWDEDQVLRMLEAIIDVGDKWDMIFSPEEEEPQVEQDKPLPNNILFLDCDTLVISPVEVFGKLDRFQLFNYTDPKTSNEPNHYNVQHQHFFNADVRYYPSTMSQDIWDMGLEMAENWDFDSWNTEQFILNKMLWDQPNRTLENTLNPLMAYQGHELYLDGWEERKVYSNKWNGCEIKDAHIIHLHGSRNAPNKFALIEQLEELS